MNILIAYYSKTGNTKVIAEQINELFQKNNNVKLFRIKPKKKYFLISTKLIFGEDDLFYSYNFSPKAYLDVRLKRKPDINKIDFDTKVFDYIILCSPIWFGDIPPQVDKFIEEIVKTISLDQKFIIVVTSGKCKKEFEEIFTNRLLNENYKNVEVIGMRNKFFKNEHKQKLLQFIKTF